MLMLHPRNIPIGEHWVWQIIEERLLRQAARMTPDALEKPNLWIWKLTPGAMIILTIRSQSRELKITKRILFIIRSSSMSDKQIIC